MWWSLIVLVLCIVVIIIIIILQQFDDVNTLHSEYSLMDYPVTFRKSANLHIKDGRHGLICISDIDDWCKRSPVANIHTIFPNFFLNTLR